MSKEHLDIIVGGKVGCRECGLAHGLSITECISPRNPTQYKVNCECGNTGSFRETVAEACKKWNKEQEE